MRRLYGDSYVKDGFLVPFRGTSDPIELPEGALVFANRVVYENDRLTFHKSGVTSNCEGRLPIAVDSKRLIVIYDNGDIEHALRKRTVNHKIRRILSNECSDLIVLQTEDGRCYYIGDGCGYISLIISRQLNDTNLPEKAVVFYGPHGDPFIVARVDPEKIVMFYGSRDAFILKENGKVLHADERSRKVFENIVEIGYSRNKLNMVHEDGSISSTSLYEALIGEATFVASTYSRRKSASIQIIS